jgi:hypothetical protein
MQRGFSRTDCGLPVGVAADWASTKIVPGTGGPYLHRVCTDEQRPDTELCPRGDYGSMYDNNSGPSLVNVCGDSITSELVDALLNGSYGRSPFIHATSGPPRDIWAKYGEGQPGAWLCRIDMAAVASAGNCALLNGLSFFDLSTGGWGWGICGWGAWGVNHAHALDSRKPTRGPEPQMPRSGSGSIPPRGTTSRKRTTSRRRTRRCSWRSTCRSAR